jgi:hypothetical protein
MTAAALAAKNILRRNTKTALARCLNALAR